MKMKSKLLIFLIIVITLILSYSVISKSITKTDSLILSKIKSVIPISVKNLIKSTFFESEILNKRIKELNEIILSQNIVLKNRYDTIKEIPSKFLNGYYPFITFKKKNSDKIYNINNLKYKLSKFETGYLGSGKAGGAAASGYFEEYTDKIFLATGDGQFFYFYKDKLSETTFDAITINSNFKDAVKFSKIYVRSDYGIKGFFLKNKKIYVSYSNEMNKDCFNTEILVAELNFQFLKFEKFFSPKNCIKKKNQYGAFVAHIAGGKMFDYNDNKILFSHGGYGYAEKAQSKDDVFGKILSINANDGTSKIISMGHRNVQGIFFDKENNTILSTEHGPMGGDELNINVNPEKNSIKNYGWPISSYGSHGVGNDWMYDKGPLNKSHKKYGFIEPIIYYVPSIGISPIEKIPNNFNLEFNNDYFIGAMGADIDEGDKSIHHIKLDNDFKKILSNNIIPINERVRDIKYIKSINKVLLFLENSPAIGLLSLVD